MKARLILLSLTLVMLLILTAMPMASAGILIGQPENVYNIGDRLEVSVTLNPSTFTNDFLTLDIGCGDESVEIYRNPFNLNSGEQVIIDVIAVLDKSLIGTLMGEDCQLIANYGFDSASSQDFEITNEIDINLNLQGNRYAPGEEISISGAALKKGGGSVEGFVEVSIGSLGVSTSNVIQEGAFSFSFMLPQEAMSGGHTMNIRIYEESSNGEISNEGEVSEIIEISQVLSSLEILISSQSVSPDEEFTYTINALDQADDLIEKEISLTIYEPGDFVFLNKVVNSGEESSIELDFENSPGYWKIEIFAGELSERKLFYVEEIEKIQTSLINNTLIVTNMGNVPYRGPIEISIGSAVEIKQLNLKIGETKKFRLYAPDGTYSIGVNDGREQVELGNTLLTGNAIGIEDLGEGFIVGFSQPLVWLLGVILLALIIVYIKGRASKKRKGTVGKSGLPQKINKGGKSGSIMHGTKENASIIALKIDSKKASSYVSSTIEKTLMVAKNSGAKVYVDGNYRILLFSPSLTKIKDNEVLAVKVAKRIEEVFKEHNKKFREKIVFGIGVNMGQIISEIKEDKFIFTTLGNVISKAKGIAQGVNSETLLSDSMRRGVLNEIKTEKAKEDTWRIAKIVDRGKHEGFLRKFMPGKD